MQKQPVCMVHKYIARPSLSARDVFKLSDTQIPGDHDIHTLSTGRWQAATKIKAC